jgi:hypothetical protein
LLQRNNEFLTTWIPEVFAEVGKVLKLKENDRWSDGWKVMKVYSRRESTEVSERSKDYKKQRKASDIARGSRKKLD